MKTIYTKFTLTCPTGSNIALAHLICDLLISKVSMSNLIMPIMLIYGGIKHSFKIGNVFWGLKAGSRVFFDNQILSEWKKEHGESASSTIRNFFHGPFIMIMGTF